MLRKMTLVGLVIVTLAGLQIPHVAQAQTEWTCDEGETDVLNAAQAAFDAGDYAQAAELAGVAVTLCTHNIRRLQTALGLQEMAETQLEIAEQAAAEADLIANSEPGLVDLGDYSLFMRCEGERQNPDDPIVIFESGGNMPIETWDDVFPAIVTETRACVYDRLGVGLSDPVAEGEIRTARNMADDLALLLETAEIEGPYLFVGHSLAGLILRIFIAEHLDQVVGAVMVDVSTAGMIERLAEADPNIMDDLLPVGSGPEHLDFLTSIDEAGAVGDFGDIPLIVLTAEDSPSAVQRPVWLELQAELAALSTNGEHRILEDVNHFIQNDEPEVVIEAILEILDAARDDES